MFTRIVFLVLAITMLSVTGCTSSNQSSGQSQVREEPNDGRSAHQSTWEQGRVPKELNSQKKLPPIEGTKTTTSTTAPTGEVETPPSASHAGQ